MSFPSFVLSSVTFSSIASTIFAHLNISFATSERAAAGCPVNLLSRYIGCPSASCSVSFLSGTSIITIFTMTGISGIQISVIVMLKPVCAFSICLEITSTSLPFGEIYWISAAYGFTRKRNKIAPEILNTQCANAVLLASFGCPIDAITAVMVVPILSPRRIGIAPVRPIILVTPSGPACDAKFCNTAIVALLLCTTSVISAPTATPRTGMCDTFPIISTKNALDARGFITSPIVSIPRNKRPNANIVCPIFLTFCFFDTKAIRNPTNIKRYM